MDSRVEKILLETEKDTHEGIDLNEVYERLDEIGSDEATARAGSILGGLGFDAAAQAKATREFSGGGACASLWRRPSS